MIFKKKPAGLEAPKVDDVTSPDILIGPPKRGAGIRRFNRVPMLIVGGFVATTLAVTLYSMADRAAKQNAPQGGTAKAEDKANIVKPTMGQLPENITHAQTNGVVPAGSGLAEPAQLQINTVPAPQGAINPLNYAAGQVVPAIATGAVAAAVQQTQQGQAPGGVVTQVYQSPYEAQWRQYDQAKASITQTRFDRASQAYSADMGVDAKGRSGSNAAPSSPTSELDKLIAQTTAQLTKVGAGGGAGGAMPAPTPVATQGQAAARFYSSARLQPAQSPNEIKAGSVIPAVLITGINSDLPGQLVAQVSRNVYDSVTGRYLLIPQGAKLVGVYGSDPGYGQARVQVAWNRLILPDGTSFDLGQSPGADRGGYSGFNDKVNNHYARAYGSALMTSLFSAGIQLSQPQASNGQNISAGQTTAAAIGQEMGQLGMEQARKNLNIKPELRIRPGFRFNVAVTQDLILKEWRAR